MMYAYLAQNPKTRWGKGGRPAVWEPIKPGEGPRWREEDWSIGSRLFTGEKSLSHCRAGVSIPHTSTLTVWDARMVPDDAVAHIRAIDEAMQKLRIERQAYIEEHFREWPPMTEADCVSTVKAKFKSEKEAKRAMGPQPKVTAEQRARESRFNDALGAI